MLVLSQTMTAAMADDGLTNLNWLVQQNPIAPLSPSTPPASPSPLPYSSNSSTSSVSSSIGEQNGPPSWPVSKSPDYSRERIKPPYSYAQLITMAMESHGGRRVLLTDIYSWIRDNFAYFRGNDTSWQNSVRHNLSLNKQFVKVPRDPKDKGKGSYWKLDTANCNLTKDPYCLRRRNFADNGSSSRRVQRPEVSHPQVNPAIKTFLERVRRLQEAQRHPFAGTGERVEDIGAQECVYTDSEPLFDDFNRKLFKKDVELYDPSESYRPLISSCGDGRKRQNELNFTNLKPLTNSSDPDPDPRPHPDPRPDPDPDLGHVVDDQHESNRAKVRVEYNWEAYEYHPSNVAGAQLPLEPEQVRLDLRIPTPEWWSTNFTTHNLLLSPSNANPMVKVFENLNNSSGCYSVITSSDPSPNLVTTCNTIINIMSPSEPEAGLGPANCAGNSNLNNSRLMNANSNPDARVADDKMKNRREIDINDQRMTTTENSWTDNRSRAEEESLLLNLDYSTTGAEMTAN